MPPTPLHTHTHTNTIDAWDGCVQLKDLLGKAVERTSKIEQVNLNGGRLLREAKVCVTRFVDFDEAVFRIVFPFFFFQFSSSKCVSE